MLSGASVGGWLVARSAVSRACNYRGPAPTPASNPPVNSPRIPVAVPSTLHSFPPMKTVTLTATFDGEHIRLEDDYPLLKDAKLLVTVLPPEFDGERAEWLRLWAHNLNRAYAPDEPEYPESCLKERNPLYEGR
jgi:hypothetical protein